MTALRIALVGAGQLGSRHLQALSLLERAAEITVVDPSAASLATARERFEQAAAAGPRKATARYVSSFADLPKALDAAVVATAADVRLAALEKLLGASRPRVLLLEKVLFQRLADYDAADRLLQAIGARAWVNCAQRLWPFFSGLRPRTLGRSNVQITVSGAQWGLGCNAIHNLDLLPFMTGDGECRLEGALDAGTIPSKRAGFVEFTGSLYAHGRRGNRVVQTSYREGSAPFEFEVQAEDFRALWRVADGSQRIADAAGGWKWEEKESRAPFQSQLTHAVLLEMIEKGRSDLPEYRASAVLHRLLLTTLLQHQSPGQVGATQVCAIT